MYRLDTDQWIILFVRCGDHLHRCAFPNHWTIALCATAAWENMREMRRDTDRGHYTFALAGGDVKHLLNQEGIVGNMLPDGTYVEVHRWEDAKA